MGCSKEDLDTDDEEKVVCVDDCHKIILTEHEAPTPAASLKRHTATLKQAKMMNGSDDNDAGAHMLFMELPVAGDDNDSVGALMTVEASQAAAEATRVQQSVAEVALAKAAEQRVRAIANTDLAEVNRDIDAAVAAAATVALAEKTAATAEVTVAAAAEEAAVASVPVPDPILAIAAIALASSFLIPGDCYERTLSPKVLNIVVKHWRVANSPIAFLLVYSEKLHIFTPYFCRVNP